MAGILVLGGGICGLAASMMLARDGHAVTVLERDPAPVPDAPQDAWEAWGRDGVTQFRQAHYMQPRGRHVLDAELPDVRDALLDAGALRLDPMMMMPPSITDRSAREGDDRFPTVTARRPVIEQVLARLADDEPGVDVRRGVTVQQLLGRRVDGIPHVSGARTADGDELSADLVVDAMGRRSPMPRLLAELGADPLHEQAEDSGFIYYTRFYRGAQLPAIRAAPLTPVGTISLLTLPADNLTWSVTIFISSGDRPLKRLRETDRFSAAVAAHPLQAHWLDGEPLTDVTPMGGIADRMRRLHVDSQPVATGVVLLGDSCVCTNPSVGRGMALGLLHAQRLRAVVREHLEHPREFADAWDADTQQELVPWYEATVRDDRARWREIEALRRGLDPPPPADRAAAVWRALPGAAPRDPDAFRTMIDHRACLADPDAPLEPAIAERILALTAGDPPPPFPGPSREQLLALLA